MARGRRANVAEEQAELTVAERRDIAQVHSREHYPPLWIDFALLNSTGIREDITRMLTRSGWPRLLTLSCPEDVNDTSDFLGTFQFINTEDDPYVEYVHRGVRRQVTLRQLRSAFGWPQNGEIFTQEVGLGYATAWGTLSTTPYEGGQNKATQLTDPRMFYLHHIFCKTVIAKKNSNKVGTMELALLYLVSQGRRVDWAHYFCTYLKNLKSRSPICCGGMITHLVRHLHGQPVRTDNLRYSTFADFLWFRSGKSVQMTHDGVVQWCHSDNVELNPPPIERRPRGRPRNEPAPGPQNQIVVRDASPPQGRPRRTFERGESSNSQASGSQTQADAATRAHIDYMFHLMRTTFMYGQEIAMVPAPEGWLPGMPIPPEYMVPFPPGP